MSEEVLSINFKILGNPSIETIDLPADSNLDTLKVLVSDFCTIPLEDIRILYKGRSLKETDTLISLGIHSGETLIVVPKRKPAQESPQPQQQQQNAEQPNQQNQPQTAVTVENQAQEQGNQEGSGRQRRQHRRRRPRILGLGPFPMPIFGNRIPNNNNNNGTGDEDQPPRVEAQQIRELRKQIAKLQQKVSLLNTDLIQLQKTITTGHPDEITEKIGQTKTKINDVIPELQQISDQFSFDPNGEIFLNEQANEQSNESTEPQGDSSGSQDSQESAEAPEPPQSQQTPVEQEQSQENQTTQQQQPQQSEPESVSVNSQPAPSVQPRNGFNNIFQSLFGRGANNVIPSPEQSIFSPEEIALMDNDAALLQSEVYSQPLNDLYTSTDLYSTVL